MIYWNSFVFTTFAAKTNPRQPMTRLLIAIFLGGGTGQRTALLRADDAPRAHSPLLFPMGYIHSQYPRKFPHRAILYLIRPFQPFYWGTAVADYRSVRRIHHLLHFQQWRTDSDKARILRNVCLIYLIKYHIRSPGSLRRRRLRTLYITQTPLWNPASLLSCLPYASSLLP